MSTPDTTSLSNHDREQVADLLRDAVGTGRLTLAEFDERVGAAYAASTRQDLAVLVADLPQPQQTVAAPAAVTTRPAARDERAEQWRSWAGGALMLVGIWAAISLMAGSALFFWPVIPIVIWAVSIVAGRGRHSCAGPSSRP